MFIQKKYAQPFAMWLLPLLFFSYQFILRLWPGLMMHPIMQQFSIDARHFGLMAAFYYFGYAGMQIPIACLMEKIPTKWILFLFIMLCGIATLLFTWTNNFYIACGCRFLIGAGSAAGFLGVSKVISEWFPAKNYSKMIAYSFSIGLLGAIYGGKPVSLLIDHFHWQRVAIALSIAAIIIATLNVLFLKAPAKNYGTIEKADFKFKTLVRLLSSPEMVMLAMANLFMVGALEGFSDVWGVPYLMTAYSIEKGTAAELISFIFFGMLFGGPVLTALGKRFGHYNIIAGCGLVMSFLFMLMLLTPYYSGPLLACLFFLVGILCCYQVLVFTAGSTLVKPQYLGVTIAFLNSVNMLGGSFFHTLIGTVMDFYRSGAGQYNLYSYHHALMVIPIFSALGAAILLVLNVQARLVTDLNLYPCELDVRD